MTAYYNEIDPYAAQWLRNLIAAGHIAPGDVDERSIEDVVPSDLAGYEQCHFFAGIGGWSYALRLAGWPDDRPAWTGSCPCQPFSAAGQRGGFADERHLWPAWYWLIQQCRPGVVFGEQVSSAIGHGWLDLVCTDLEASGYAVGPVVLPAASVGAPHKRERVWFVGHAGRCTPRGEKSPSGENNGRGILTPPGPTSELADAECLGLSGVNWGRAGGQPENGNAASNPWLPCDWLPCRDGKSRPVEPGTFPLAHGVPARVGRLRAYGNAIVPQVAAQVIAAYMEVAQ